MRVTDAGRVELIHELVANELAEYVARCTFPPTGHSAVPVFVIQGAEDYTTPTRLARTFVDSLHSPRKAFATIEGAGHFAVFTKQDAFLTELRARVLPLIHPAS